MKKENIYVMIIGKEEHVEKGDILPVLKTIGTLEQAGLETFQSMAIAFHGYDDTSVEVWEDPAVRKWCHKLINKVPHLFYFLENGNYETQKTMMLCLNEFESVLLGERKSPDEHAKEGTALDELPKHQILIHVHQKSFRQMCAEIRKYAHQKGKRALAEQLIMEMKETYGIE